MAFCEIAFVRSLTVNNIHGIVKNSKIFHRYISSFQWAHKTYRYVVYNVKRNSAPQKQKKKLPMGT